MMENTNGIITKEATEHIQLLSDNSIQDKLTTDRNILNNFLNMTIKEGELLPPWWSSSRDIALNRMAFQNDQFKGSVHKVQNRITAANWLVVPRDPTIKKHINLAKVYNSILFDSLEFGQGLYVWLDKWLWALFTQDNGAFAGIIDEAGTPYDMPVASMVIGSDIWDSSKCTRTSNPMYPVVYSEGGIKTAVHHSRVMFSSQMPHPAKGMNGVGQCWLSRAVDTVQNLMDVAIYKQEKLGSRPNSQIIVASGGLDKVDIAKAILLANQSNDNQGLTRYAKKAIVGDVNRPEGAISKLDLVDTDIFNEKESLEIGMASLALSGGYPFRDFWPSQGAIAKSDAEFAHITGTSGYKQLLDTIVFLFSGNPNSEFNITPKFLPRELELTVTLIDDDQQQRMADVKKKRAETWSIQLKDEVLDRRTIRELAFKTGDITQQQFERQELQDGRLPDGEKSILLFLSEKPFIKRLLTLPFDDVLDVVLNRSQAVEIIAAINKQLEIVNTTIINSGSTPILLAARQARSALEALKKEYEKVLVVDIAANEDSSITPVVLEETQEAKPVFNPGGNFRPRKKPTANTEDDTTKEIKETTGANLPFEVQEYEEAIQALIEEGTSGNITQEEFESELEDLTIEFTTAMFLLGIGLDGEDLEDSEREFLAEQIQINLDAISGLSNDVYSGAFLAVASGGNGNNIIARSALWGGVLGSVFYAGMLLIREDTIRYQWVWTPGKDHCADCRSRNGLIKTAREWRKDFNNGIYPKSSGLACKGFYCGCGFIEVLSS